jgi:hypothetical protein
MLTHIKAIRVDLAFSSFRYRRQTKDHAMFTNQTSNMSYTIDKSECLKPFLCYNY